MKIMKNRGFIRYETVHTPKEVLFDDQLHKITRERKLNTEICDATYLSVGNEHYKNDLIIFRPSKETLFKIKLPKNKE